MYHHCERTSTVFQVGIIDITVNYNYASSLLFLSSCETVLNKCRVSLKELYGYKTLLITYSMKISEY